MGNDCRGCLPTNIIPNSPRTELRIHRRTFLHQEKNLVTPKLKKVVRVSSQLLYRSGTYFFAERPPPPAGYLSPRAAQPPVCIFRVEDSRILPLPEKYANSLLWGVEGGSTKKAINRFFKVIILQVLLARLQFFQFHRHSGVANREVLKFQFTAFDSLVVCNFFRPTEMP